MPYRFDPPEKTSSLAILGFVRDRAELIPENSQLGHCTCVYNVEDFLASVKYATQKHRRNDASVRLRTLEVSGYLRKVGKGYVDERVTAASAAEQIAAHAGAGRPAAIYALTEQGVRYAKTIADRYLNEEGEEIPREIMMPNKKAAWVVLSEGGFRVIALAPDKNTANEIVTTWAKKVNQSLKIKETYLVVEPEKEGQ